MRRLLILALFATPALAGDDQLALMQAALQVCQQQTADANANALQRIATLTVELAKVQRRVQELEAGKPEKK